MTDRPLKIAMISYYLPSGSKIGVGYQVDVLARAMVAAGHEVDVFSACPPVETAPYGHVQLRLKGRLATFQFAWALRSVDFSGYDVVHAHGDDYWLWGRRAPVHIRTMHGSCFEEALRIHGTKERLRMLLLGLSELLATAVADRTVMVSPQTRRWMPWVRSVIPNGVDLDRFHPDEHKRTEYPVVLFVGAWKGRKRGAELAEQFGRIVRPAVPDAELWMVSQDVPKTAPDGVRQLGRLSDAELADVYRRAWVFCLPSDYEGFGIPYAEAMASGLPVVATPNVGARYVTDGGRSGVLSELPKIGGSLVSLLGDSARRAQLSRAGLERAEVFALRSVVDKYLSCYAELLDVTNHSAV